VRRERKNSDVALLSNREPKNFQEAYVQLARALSSAKIPYTLKQLLKIHQILNRYPSPSDFEPLVHVLCASIDFEYSCLIGHPSRGQQKSDLEKSYNVAKKFHDWFIDLHSDIREKLESEFKNIGKIVGPIFHWKKDPPVAVIKLRHVDITRAIMDAQSIYLAAEAILKKLPGKRDREPSTKLRGKYIRDLAYIYQKLTNKPATVPSNPYPESDEYPVQSYGEFFDFVNACLGPLDPVWAKKTNPARGTEIRRTLGLLL